MNIGNTNLETRTSVQRRASETRAPHFSLERRAVSHSAALLVTAPRFSYSAALCTYMPQ